MEGKKYSSLHNVLYYESEKTHRMTLPMLLNVLIQVSGEQSTELGLSEEKMAEMGYAWIVLQHEFKIKRMPRTNETIEVETHALQYNKFFCYRKFNVTGENGEHLVDFLMVFAVLDLDKRKMIRIPDEVVSPYEAPFVKRPLQIKRPEELAEAEATSMTYQVRYFDIDANNHVNNSKYIEWMFDVLGSDFLTNHEVKSGNIKFEKEVFYGQRVNAMASIKKEGGKTGSAHRIQTEEGTHCIASFTWE